MRKRFISVILPVYNEEKLIASSLFKISSYLKIVQAHEIIVVDDGSMDKTKEIVNKLGEEIKGLRIISNARNCGKGFAVRRGIFESKGEIILFSDIDLSTPIEEFDKLLFWIDKGYDVVIASREIKGAEIYHRQQFYRRVMGKVFILLVRFFLCRGIKDIECGFKCFRRKAALSIFRKLHIEGFAFDAEVLYLANMMGFKIKEVPVKWSHFRASKVNVLRDAIRAFRDLLKIMLLYKK